MSSIRVLIIEDSPADATLLLRELQKAGYSPVHERVDTAREMERALAEKEWDIILCDYVMPQFSGLAALEVLRRNGCDIPFIMVSGQIGEDTAVGAMKAGAQDYVFKGNLTRLGEAVRRELEDAHVRRERRRAERELKAREEELLLSRKTEQIKDEFIGMVSHELKTPLTVIIGALSVAMANGLPAEQARELVRDAISQAETLSRIVDNLLELARYRADRLNLQKERTDVGGVVEAVLKKMQSGAGRHRLVADVPGRLPAVVMDRTRVELVVHNLVQNAVKYSPQGGEVSVSVRSKGGYLVVSVRDSGIGIPTKAQTGLFQDFQRLSPGESAMPGVGLGLKVCRILVEAHGGRIWVESSPGKGSTFFFALPAAKAGAVVGR